MRKCFFLIFMLFVLFSPVALGAGTYQEEIESLSLKIATNIEKSGKRAIAVVDFTDLQGNITELGRFVAEELSVSLVFTGKGFQVIDRLHLKSILAEHKLSLSGLTDPKTVKKLGKITGVDAIVIGTVTPFGDSIRVSAKVITTDTAMVIAAATGNIAKTKAIEELLEREIRQPGKALTRAEPLEKKRVVIGDIELRLLKIERGPGISFYFVATNNSGKDVGLCIEPFDCFLYDELANKYKAIYACVGSDCGRYRSACGTLIAGVSIKASVTFESIPSKASIGTLKMGVHKDGFGTTIAFQNLSLK